MTHKIAHGFAGAALGSIMADDPRKGAIAGAIGGVASEIIAEAVLGNIEDKTEAIFEKAAAEGRSLNQEEFQELYQDKVKANFAADCGKMGAALVALLAQQDVPIAIATATNAVENNLLPALVTIGLIAWEAYDLYDTLEKEGVEAAVKKLGFDLALATTGVYAGKRVYQLGKLMAPTAKAALALFMEANPTFARFYDKAAAGIARGVAKLKAFDAKLDAKLGQAWTKTTEKMGLGKGASSKLAEPEMFNLDPQYWNKTIEFRGNKVYQRNDLIDPNFITKQGQKNIQLMKEGLGSVHLSKN